jgi:hypothetical protein
MAPDDPVLEPRERAVADAIRRVLHETAEANPLGRPLISAHEWGARPSVHGWARVRALRAGLAVGLALMVAAAGMLAIGSAGVAGPSAASTAPLSSAGSSAGRSPRPSAIQSTGVSTAAPASIGPGLGSFEPILDVAEPLSHTGSAAMHESLGSASDGVVFIEDYGSSPDGGNNLYHVTLYRSFDGLAWQTVSVPTPHDQQDSQVACRGWNCVVVSSFPQNGSMLVTDDGQHWDTVSAVPKLGQATLTAGASGFVMSGWELKTFKNRLVFSSNGRDWQNVRFETGSPPLESGLAVSDPTAGWFMFGGYGSGSDVHQAIALSADGLNWRDAPDPTHVYETDFLVGQTAFHFDGRWYVLAGYRQMPADYSSGGFGLAASTSTPIATWQAIYWIDDGSVILHSSGRISTTLPEQVVVMDGYLVGARVNPDFTTSLVISTDGRSWTDEGLLPPGVPEPAYIHGVPFYSAPALRRAGDNVVMQGDALQPNEMGVGLYVAKPLG